MILWRSGKGYTCVDVLEPPEQLVQEKLVVLRREIVVGFYDLKLVEGSSAGLAGKPGYH